MDIFIKIEREERMGEDTEILSEKLREFTSRSFFAQVQMRAQLNSGQTDSKLNWKQGSQANRLEEKKYKN